MYTDRNRKQRQRERERERKCKYVTAMDNFLQTINLPVHN